MKKVAIAVAFALLLGSGVVMADNNGKGGKGQGQSQGQGQGHDQGKDNGKDNGSDNGKDKGPKTHTPDPPDPKPTHRMSADEMGAAGLTLATLLAAGVYLVRRKN